MWPADRSARVEAPLDSDRSPAGGTAAPSSISASTQDPSSADVSIPHSGRFPRPVQLVRRGPQRWPWLLSKVRETFLAS